MKLHLEEKLQELLIQVVEKEQAIKGNIQIYDPVLDELQIVVQYGFEKDFLDHFSCVKPFDASTCGRAFGAKLMRTINDTETDISFTEHREIAKKAGFRAVKSVPLFDKNMNPIGVISTHFKEPKLFWENKDFSSVFYDISTYLMQLLESNYFQKNH